MSSNAQVTVKSRYARCPIASPNAKYSQSANTVITAVATATAHVGVNNTVPATTGINTSAVATRFQVMQTVLTGRLPNPSQNESGFPAELYRYSRRCAGGAADVSPARKGWDRFPKTPQAPQVRQIPNEAA